MKLALGFLTALFPFSVLAASPIDISVTSHGGTAPLGSQRIPLLSVQLAVPCGEDAILTSLTLAHRGAGEAKDFVSIYASINGRRVGRPVRTLRDEAALIRLPSTSLPKCTTTIVDILGDLSVDAAAAGEHLWSVSAIDAGGRETRIASSGSSSTARPTTVGVGQTPGTIVVDYPELLRPVTYGARRTVLRLRVKAKDRDQQVQSITLTNDGSARDSDLQNLYLQNSRGEKITSVAATMDGDRIELSFDPPLTLTRNDVRVLELVADVRASRRRTIRFTLEESSDLIAVPCVGKTVCNEAH